MRRSHPVRRGLSLALAVVIAWTAVPWPAPVEAGSQRLPLTQGISGKLPIQELSEEEAIGHALNRLGFGPRPGDVERVRAMGLEGWIKRQLQPETLDDSRVMARLERYPTLTMSASELLRAFPQPQPAARRPGQDPAERRRERERSAAGVRPSEMENERQGELQGERQGERQERKGETGTAPPAPGEQRELLRRRLLDGDPDRRMRLAELTGPRRVIGELAAAKFTRAIYSERQLHEVMVDFWFNHFNVFAIRSINDSGGSSETNRSASLAERNRAVLGCRASRSSTASPSFIPPASIFFPSAIFGCVSCRRESKVNSGSRRGAWSVQPVKQRATSMTSSCV